MAKFKIGSKVSYGGNNETLRDTFKGMEVIDIIPNGINIGNGEINRSGQDIYRCSFGPTMFNFLESELVNE